jgi:hypothetical protein
MKENQKQDGLGRRDFLRSASLVSLALALGCGRDASSAEIEAAIRSFILAVGPWDEAQREEAEAFATKFLAVRGGELRAHGSTTVALANRAPFRSSPMALAKLDLSGRTPEEKKLLSEFVTEIYSLIAIHYVVAGRSPVGQCAGRVQYTLPPEEWAAGLRKVTG